MPADVVCRRVIRRIARYEVHLVRIWLVDSHIVNFQDRRKTQCIELDCLKARRDAQIHDDAHGLHGNNALAYVNVGSRRDRGACDSPSCFSVYIPSYVAIPLFFPIWGIFHTVLGKDLLAIDVATRGNISHRRNRLLIYSSGVRIELGDGVVVDCSRRLAPLVFRIKRGNLQRL